MVNQFCFSLLSTHYSLPHCAIIRFCCHWNFLLILNIMCLKWNRSVLSRLTGYNLIFVHLNFTPSFSMCKERTPGKTVKSKNRDENNRFVRKVIKSIFFSRNSLHVIYTRVREVHLQIVHSLRCRRWRVANAYNLNIYIEDFDFTADYRIQIEWIAAPYWRRENRSFTLPFNFILN